MAGFLEVQLGLHSKKFVGRICWVELGSIPLLQWGMAGVCQGEAGLTHPLHMARR